MGIALNKSFTKSWKIALGVSNYGSQIVNFLDGENNVLCVGIFCFQQGSP